MTGQFKNFLVSDLFEVERGKSLYTRAYADKHAGKYPVYSASLAAPLCYINKHDYNGQYLTWTTNGYGGRIQIISDKFSINGDRGILIPKANTELELEYIKYVLEPLLIEQAVGRIVDGIKNEYTKVSPDVVANTSLTLPIDKKDRPDFKRMLAAADKIRNLKTLQNSLQKYHDEISDIEILIDAEVPSKIINLDDPLTFSLSIGERILKKDNRDCGVPAYSANVNVPFGYVEKSNLNDFSRDSILWGIDGIFEWNLIPQGNNFATTDHCGRLLILSDDIDPEYAFYYLQSTRFEYGFDRVLRANLDNIRKLVTIKIPVNAKDKPCLKTQKSIAKQYREIHSLKANVLQTLENVSKVKVDISF